MANSSIIGDLKSAVITEIINDEGLFHAINSPDITNFQESDQLINTHLFRFHQNPDTISREITFLTFQVHISNISSQNLWVKPTLEIWIFSHNNHMLVDNIPQIVDDRNDYISKLLDLKFNGRSSIGDIQLCGELTLKSNVEGAFNQKFLYRRMIFETKDINNSFCWEKN